ncbi:MULTISPECIES: DUF5032 domain-containing protein [Parabacteroides]|uniref:DUF5032 domain-containing protein n=3 Tax=Parabacteroides goldsteinii TaxID=328812 RepID=A0A6G1ZJ12_9BACT|nr:MULTISPECIES: DUF5032 domain-containing protein [Parabacteroides]EOS18296.1 hypothetical protein C803_01958 [Parabacteroides goldsteinii dnLKV18]KAI4362133.1 hypothetical protein C825_004211 [Parabacteroides sp. ASF519]MBF0767340.1 DUF5032 domain-containing protein [Parabacteroides goldsteinii]MDZ3928217.1 DUF5032 domain-containing protein [Parabacteroides goldsteinii]MRX94300.1 DUF5032 domain-containing protein [Parabacteroides goldsteinii]
MKKCVCLMLILVIGLISCGDDDKPSLPKLNKLTKITCKKNGADFPEYSLDIIYNQDGNVSKITTSKGTFNLIYTGNKISVIDASNVHTEDFQISGNVVVNKQEWAINEYVPNAEYVKNEYRYKYDRSNLTEADWIFQRPLEEGGYKKNDPVSLDKYTWTNGNVTVYQYLPRDEVSYTYGSQLCPANFPFRVLNTLRPITPDLVNPLNSLYGTSNRNLPESASRYSLGESKNGAEYTFRYQTVGDYITGMVITEDIKSVEGLDAGQNTYEYSFVYNYETN